VHCVTYVQGSQVHPATRKRSASRCAMTSEELLRTSTSSTVESGPSSFGLRSFRFHQGSDAWPVRCYKWVSPRSRLPLFTDYWSEFLPQSDARNLTLAKVLCSGWGFCRQVNTVYTFDWHGVFVCVRVLYLIVKLILSWLSMRPSYILREGRTISGSAS
jgi:hypothetical protein